MEATGFYEDHDDGEYENAKKKAMIKSATSKLAIVISIARVSIDHPRMGQNRAFQFALLSMHLVEGLTFREIENSPLQAPHSTAERQIKRLIKLSSQVTAKLNPKDISLPLSEEQCDSISKVYLALTDICPNSKHSTFEPFREFLLYEKDRNQAFERMLLKAGCTIEDIHTTAELLSQINHQI